MDFANKVGIADHIPHRDLVGGVAFGCEVSIFDKPGSDLYIRIQFGSVVLEHCHQPAGMGSESTVWL